MSMTKADSQKQFRASAASNAVASSLLEGVRPSATAMANLRRYVEGQVTTQALIADAKRRHARAG